MTPPVTSPVTSIKGVANERSGVSVEPVDQVSSVEQNWVEMESGWLDMVDGMFLRVALDWPDGRASAGPAADHRAARRTRQDDAGPAPDNAGKAGAPHLR